MTRKMRSAYTLTELLVATAVGSIVMAMAFSSFSVINQKYQKYSDLSNLHRSSTQVLNIIYYPVRILANVLKKVAIDCTKPSGQRLMAVGKWALIMNNKLLLIT